MTILAEKTCGLIGEFTSVGVVDDMYHKGG